MYQEFNINHTQTRLQKYLRLGYVTGIQYKANGLILHVQLKYLSIIVWGKLTDVGDLHITYIYIHTAEIVKCSEISSSHTTFMLIILGWYYVQWG